jgi:hypothetical protein
MAGGGILAHPQGPRAGVLSLGRRGRQQAQANRSPTPRAMRWVRAALAFYGKGGNWWSLKRP